jgi:hypothetical protein
MNDKEITEFVNLIEETWLENMVARNYLKSNCGISNPTEFLQKEMEKIPQDALARRLFAPVKQALGQGLQDTESLARLYKALLEFSKTLKG